MFLGQAVWIFGRSLTRPLNAKLIRGDHGNTVGDCWTTEYLRAKNYTNGRGKVFACATD